MDLTINKIILVVIFFKLVFVLSNGAIIPVNLVTKIIDKCNATIAVVGKIMAYETCGIPKILIRIRNWW